MCIYSKQSSFEFAGEVMPLLNDVVLSSFEFAGEIMPLLNDVVLMPPASRSDAV